ncbi:hypothetical protein [Aeromicrobium terrae]|uniref:Uncharacterized protein n=1 Tax=Aeromicrobium terrae TaxID=2498846 RepID=A0A5C8NCG5_9ACTN|nr:hypothetical protein [Aeromicrobium terrae]TXL57277.1 hypothetical protein FHP06_14645 [Aeromicrobium terrae]
MDRSTAVRIGIAGIVASLGLAVGGVALASADSDGPDLGVHPGAPHRAERGDLAKSLAKELGVSESKVKDALDAVRDQHRPGRVDRDEVRKEVRADLVKPLDKAVEDGTLTKADKASVLKAFNAKILGGGFGRPGPR